MSGDITDPKINVLAVELRHSVNDIKQTQKRQDEQFKKHSQWLIDIDKRIRGDGIKEPGLITICDRLSNDMGGIKKIAWLIASTVIAIFLAILIQMIMDYGSKNELSAASNFIEDQANV